MPSGGFCSANTEIITFANYKDVYANATRHSCLPNAGQGFQVSPGANGLIDQSTVNTYITQLLTTNNATSPALDSVNGNQSIPNDMNTASTYATNSYALRTSIQNEYCFYYKRYMFALEEILKDATKSSGVSLASSSVYTTQKNTAQLLNSKLNQILQILQGLIYIRSSTMSDYYGSNTGVNLLNSQLDDARTSLQKHMGALEADDIDQNIRSAMVDYTIEKNTSSRNMVALYGFMNIVAAGMLFYLYRTT